MVRDQRAKELAELVLSYSVDLQPKDKLIIQFDPQSSNYAFLIGDRARQIGAEVRYDSMTLDPKILRGLIKRFDFGEWEEELRRRENLASWCSARVLINCFSNENYAKGLKDSKEKVTLFNKKVIGPYKEVLYRPGPNGETEVKWNITAFPYNQGAKKAGMTLKEYSDFVYEATLGCDWTELSKDMEEIKSVFDYAKDVHVLVPGLTDLHLSLEDRGGYISSGTHNMPSGEVFYGPIENSVEGKIYFQIPSKRTGFGIFEGIKLEFENGVIKKYSAEKNQEGLDAILKIDEGIKSVGELGIGCNYGIKRAILETLFDEKIGGTIHLALGRSFDEYPLSRGGGLNKSDIHWDIVCDLRKNLKDLAKFPGGQIYVDGNLVQKDGIWRF